VDIPEQGIKAGDLATKDFTRWQPEKQNTVPIENRTVSQGGQYGTSARTVVLKKTAYGT
jgi:hypothetical protein